MTRSTFSAAALVAMIAATVAVPALAQDADTSDKGICFSNTKADNTWRQAMLRELGGAQAAGRRRRRGRVGGRKHDSEG